MLIASRQSFWNGGGSVPHVFRYMRLCTYALKAIESSAGASVVQISILKLVDTFGTHFVFPSQTTYSLSGWVDKYSATQGPLKMLDDSTSSKWCDYVNTGNVNLPPNFWVQFDFGSKTLDTDVYTSWQWYTADDTSMYSNRNIKDYDLKFSVDGLTWYVGDSVRNGPTPATNKSLAYTGNIIIRPQY